MYCLWGEVCSQLILQFFYRRIQGSNKPFVPCGNGKLKNPTFESDPRYESQQSDLYKGWNSKAKSLELKKHTSSFSSELEEQEAENKYFPVDKVCVLSGTKTQNTLKPGQWLPLLSQCHKSGVLEGNFCMRHLKTWGRKRICENDWHFTETLVLKQKYLQQNNS